MGGIFSKLHPKVPLAPLQSHLFAFFSPGFLETMR
jgi:hypothetical protein